MILVFGASGQLASALAGFSNVRCVPRAEVDLRDPLACAGHVRATKPSAVINAAAFTDVNRAETNEVEATTVNAASPGAMAKAAATLDIPFVSVSTDYVFDGSGTSPWTPDHATAPLNAYGRSKATGEQLIANAGGRFAILRTSWVFSLTGRNFLTTMLRLGSERDRLSVVDDQIGGPTPAFDLARACIAVANTLAVAPEKCGIYHFAGTPNVSWATFAEAIMTQAHLPCRIDRILTAAYPTPAKRPANSALDCTRFEAQFNMPSPDWRDALRKMINDRKGDKP